MVDLSQQLSQIQAQLQSMTPSSYYAPTGTQTDPRQYCQYRLPCGLCSKTNSFCGMQTTEITSEVKANEL